MRNFIIVAMMFIICGCSVASANPDENIEVFFSPGGGCTSAVVKEVGKARKEVLVQAYSFTSAPIAKALVEAHKRGVKVSILLDKSQRTERYSSLTFFNNAGMNVKIDDAHAIAHNKVIVIDGKLIITGSFNFTKAAEERNAENLLIIRNNEKLTKAYIDNFVNHNNHSH